MRHISIKLETPCEFINVTPVNPLISQCEIKVCYVGEDPNRNGSIITKEVAIQMANSLPGSPIVGFFNEAQGDFEEHNRVIDISNGRFEIKDTTRPYGFVDLNAKVWFQKFLDDNAVEREYLMTQGWLWTGQYPECKRCVTNGNNQSMELAEDFLNASWTENNNGGPEFFIINEAIISKLCILGDDAEPCFEGATVTAPTIQFSFEEGFKEQLFSMMKEIKDLIITNEGGAPVFNVFSVAVGDALWQATYSFLDSNFPMEEERPTSKYALTGMWSEDTQNFATLQDRETGKMYRMNFCWDCEEFSSDAELVEVESDYVSTEDMISKEDVDTYEAERYKKAEEEEDKGEEKKCPDCGKPESECTCKKDEGKKEKYVLEEIPEYVELLNKYSQLEEEYNTLKTEKESLDAEIAPLKEFKLSAEKEKKQAMIDSFYMLSDEDKSDVIENIDTYSLDEIEAKLSIICVRNKVKFDLEDEKGEDDKKGPTTFSLTGGMDVDEGVPAWIKAVRSTANSMK